MSEKMKIRGIGVARESGAEAVGSGMLLVSRLLLVLFMVRNAKNFACWRLIFARFWTYFLLFTIKNCTFIAFFVRN